MTVLCDAGTEVLTLAEPDLGCIPDAASALAELAAHHPEAAAWARTEFRSRFRGTDSWQLSVLADELDAKGRALGAGPGRDPDLPTLSALGLVRAAAALRSRTVHDGCECLAVRFAEFADRVRAAAEDRYGPRALYAVHGSGLAYPAWAGTGLDVPDIAEHLAAATSSDVTVALPSAPGCGWVRFGDGPRHDLHVVADHDRVTLASALAEESAPPASASFVAFPVLAVAGLTVPAARLAVALLDSTVLLPWRGNALELEFACNFDPEDLVDEVRGTCPGDLPAGVLAAAVSLAPRWKGTLPDLLAVAAASTLC